MMNQTTVITEKPTPLKPIVVEVSYKDQLTAKYTLLEYSINYGKIQVSIKLREEIYHADGTQIRDKIVLITRKNTGAQIRYEVDEEGQIIEETAEELKAAQSPVSDFINTKTGEQTISEVGQALIRGMVNEFLSGIGV